MKDHSDPLQPATPEHKLLMFRHQRNSYLTGITLFLLLVLHMVHQLLKQVFHAERKAGAVGQQEANNVDNYVAAQERVEELEEKCKRLQRENDKLLDALNEKKFADKKKRLKKFQD